MSYLTYAEYTELNTRAEDVSEADFAPLERRAERYVDRFTLTVDNVKKLKVAFPTNDDDVQAVKECVTALINVLSDLGQAEVINASQLKGGKSGIIASVSSGSESVSYVTNADILKIAGDPNAENSYMYKTARGYLEGAQDANGVNLLYGGRYPCIVTQ